MLTALKDVTTKAGSLGNKPQWWAGGQGDLWGVCVPERGLVSGFTL